MKRLFIIYILFCTISPLIAGNKGIAPQDKKLAEALLLEATHQRNIGNTDAFFDMTKWAYETDSTNVTAAFFYGATLLSTNDNPSQKEQEQAYRLLKSYVTVYPDDFHKNASFANYCSNIGKYEEALGVWQHLMKIYPARLESYYKIAETYSRMGNTDKALQTYEDLQASQGNDIEITINKLNIYLDNNDTASVKNEGRKLLMSDPKNLNNVMLMAQIYNRLGDKDSTLAYLDIANDIEPDNGEVYLAKAELYHNEGDSIMYDKMIYQALTRESLPVDTKLKVLNNYIGQLLEENDSSERIVKFFDVLIEQHPHESGIHRLYSQYLTTIKDYDKAIEQLQYALDTDPGNAEDWTRIMFVSMLADKKEKAIEAANKSLEYNPENIGLYQYIGPIYTQLKQYDKAVETFKQALEKADSTDFNLLSNLYCGLGDAYVMNGDTINGFDSYEKALEMNPGNTMALNNYAFFLAESGTQLDKAEKMSALAVRANPDNVSNLDTYAWIFFKKRDYKLAQLYIEKALDSAEKEDLGAELFDHYGDILFMLGEPEKALENWEKALSLSPDNELIARKVKFKTYFYK